MAGLHAGSFPPAPGLPTVALQALRYYADHANWEFWDGYHAAGLASFTGPEVAVGALAILGDPPAPMPADYLARQAQAERDELDWFTDRLGTLIENWTGRLPGDRGFEHTAVRELRIAKIAVHRFLEALTEIDRSKERETQNHGN